MFGIYSYVTVIRKVYILKWVQLFLANNFTITPIEFLMWVVFSNNTRLFTLCAVAMVRFR